MAQGPGTWWVRYSDYCLEKGEDGTEYIRPAPDAIPMAYDVMANEGKSVEDLVRIAHSDEELRTMRFVKRFGLLGLALEDEEEWDGLGTEDRTVFASTGRDRRYAGIFSPPYREKTARISAWLDWIVVLFNRSRSSRSGRMEREPFVALTLQSMLESAYKNMLAGRNLHVCGSCKKIYYTEDPESRTCSEACWRLYKDQQYFKKLKEAFQGHLIAGG